MEARCVEVSSFDGVSFERLDAELAELDRLLDEGRDVGDIRTERALELARLEAEAGNSDQAHAIIEELLAGLEGRTDREGLKLTTQAWSRRGIIHWRDGKLSDSADCHGYAYEVAAQAVATWKDDVRIAIMFAQAAYNLGDANHALKHHDAAIAALDKGLIVCARFPDERELIRLEASSCVERAFVMQSQGKPLPERLPWIDRAIARHARLDDPVALSTVWHDRARQQHPALSARVDYERAIAVIEHLLPDPDIAIRISKSSHNIALVLSDSPADALPFETRAVELMYDVIETRGSDENRFDLLLYRLSRTDLMAKVGALAAAIEEVKGVLPELEDVIERVHTERGNKLLATYRGHLVEWSAKLARSTPAIYRTLPPVTVTDPKAFRCTFCKRARAEVSKLISGPRVFICNHCVTAAAAALGPIGTTLVECRFCGIQRDRFVGTADGVICDDCLDLCAGIIDEAIGESHPDLRCSYCGSERGEVEKLVLDATGTALCNRCFATTRRLLDRHHPYDPALGARRGARETQFDICSWCETRDARMFLHGELIVLCDGCVDYAALDF